MTQQALSLLHSAPDDAYQAALAAVTTLQDAGFEAYLVGGAVRDLMLGMHPKDYDIATNARPHDLQNIPVFIRTHYNDTAQAYGVTRLHVKDWPTVELEVATYRQDLDPHLGRKATTVAFADLTADLQRRDFTINAIAYDPLHQHIVDINDGVADITQRYIRFIGDPAQRLQEDPLRLLRAIRLKNSLNFDYAPDCLPALQRAVEQGMVEQIAIDRLRHELTRMLVHPSRVMALADLDRLGIIARVLPEVSRGKGIAQPASIHAEGDVWHHQILAMAALPKHPTVRLAWATLLHDIGKPLTQSWPESSNDRIRFNQHYTVGAKAAHELLHRLRFPHRLRDDIVWMIAHHLNIDDLPVMRPSHQRAMLDHPAFADLLALHKADAIATWTPHGPRQPPVFTEIESIWHHYQTQQQQPMPSLKHDLGIDGHWLKKTFRQALTDTEPKLIGIVLKDLEDAYVNQNITDKHALHDRAASLITKYTSRRQ